ncbi:uncharacterized protein JCM6883_005425 [Sporobolomyces salmoneus]|uniref:uncharacterized protein n=1 Tax=Sporobolomyces salmoneus TaxID=183962 RepID=UPI00316DA21B
MSSSARKSTTHVSDQPYSTNNEITTLDDSPPMNPPRSSTRASGGADAANERTALLAGDRRQAAAPVEETGVVRRVRKPWALRIDFWIAFLLLIANGYFWTMSLASVKNAFMQSTSLPPHRGSMFLPIWISFLSCVTNTLSILSFVFPHESPILSKFTSIGTTIFAFITLIIIVAVTQLRVVEGALTGILLGLFILSSLHAVVSASLTDQYAPLLSPPDDLDPEVDGGCFASFKRVCGYTASFVGISLPLALGHIAILAATVLITIGVIIRAVDASVEQPGQRWKVDAWLWTRSYFPELGRGLTNSFKGHYYRVHLACRGVGLDDPPYFSQTASSPVNSSSFTSFGRPTVRRTVLVESEQGVPGAVDAEWLVKMLREGDLNSGDVETRVCFWDRPGYGFSDSSATSSAPHIVSALTQALSVSGEMARLEPPPSLDSSSSSSSDSSEMAPTPLARSGFIIVSRGKSTTISTLFASLHPRLVHSFLYINPYAPSTTYHKSARSSLNVIPNFFTRSLPAIYTDLGLNRLYWMLKGVTRRRRVLAREGERINGQIERAWVQERYEADLGKKSDGAKAWDLRRGRYPTRPTYVLGGTGTGGKKGESKGEGQKFVDEVVGESLRKWDKEWKGGKEGCNGGEGWERVCRDAIKDLLHLD